MAGDMQKQGKGKHSEAYVDRYGKLFVPQDNSAISKREGAFAVLIARGHILLMWPQNAPDVAELPGGGIEDGETISKALIREIYEETGVDASGVDIGDPDLTQHVKFHAENKNEFWRYDQSYFVISGAVVEALYFDGERTSPENGLVRWVRISDLENVKMHYVHKQAMQEISV